MNDNNLSVADVENILLQIHDREQFIAEKKDRRDQSIAFYKDRIEFAKKIFDQDIVDAQFEIAELSRSLETFFNDNTPTNRKSLKFAGGSFGYNKSSTKFFLNGQECNADNPDLLNLVERDHAEFLKTKKYVDWANFKANLVFDDTDNIFMRDTGELIDGLRAKKIFFVKTS